jgi:PAS domain S-box-containing protein
MAGQIEEAYHRLEARVHERTLAEQALRETEERTRFALGAARTGVWEIDLASDRVTWSDTMAAVFGLSAERVPGTRTAFLDLIHVDDRSGVSDAMAQAIRDRRDFAVDFRTVCADGSLHWVDVRSRVVCESNVPVRLLGTAIDFTERKSLEDQLRQAQKMEAIGQLAGGVAHDFNNLLTAIRGYADLVSDGLGPEHALRPDVREIVKAADRASSLTRQLLAFSRKQVLEPVLVDINSLVAASSDLLRRVIGTHIELVTNLAPNLAPIFADATQLDQIVMNLAVNARDAMAGGGRLSIETASVELDESSVLRDADVRPGRYVMLAVTDTGSGMSEETRRRLFEPFFTTKEQGRGTGLGLATVYGIVKQSGGYIWVYTEPGHGTTIKVYFPEAEGVADTDRLERPLQTPAGGTEKVLLVEDEEAVRFLTRTMLERKGYSVIDVASPMQAEATFRTRRDWIDLLITDVIMPGASGPVLFENLVKHAPGLKVLYMSGYTGDTVVQNGRIDSGIAFLQKPFTAEGLARKVREVLDQ